MYHEYTTGSQIDYIMMMVGAIGGGGGGGGGGGQYNVIKIKDHHH